MMPGLRNFGTDRGSTRAAAALAFAGLLGAVPAVPARAALGEDASTIESDSAGFRAQRAVQRPAAGAVYTVHQLLLPGGTRVREFVSPAGQVFAVTWSGPLIPDLGVLLGKHYPRYRMAAERRSAADRRPVVLQDFDLVIRNEGHARAFHGMAYLPGGLPSGFDLAQLR